MKFAIADPPYPPMLKAAGGYKPRASRWYGTEFRGNNRQAADNHPASAEWNDPARHRALLHTLVTTYDGWAIATAADALEIYTPLPVGTRIGVWHKPNGIPGSHRLRSTWEPIIIFIPATRRRNVGRGAIADVFSAPSPRNGFPGQKPPAWTRWILTAWSFNPVLDTVADLFPGTGAVTQVVQLWQGGIE